MGTRCIPKLTELRLVRLSADNSYDILPKEKPLQSHADCGLPQLYSGAAFSLTRERGQAARFEKNPLPHAIVQQCHVNQICHPVSGTFCRVIYPLKVASLERGRRDVELTIV